MTVELPRESLELVLTALVQMARETLAGDNAASSSAEGHQIVVHVDASALSGQGGESDSPLPTVKRLCCDGAVVPVLEEHGRPLDVGRRRRMVPTAIKRALIARDRTCTFPGCHHERFLEAHHVHHWADGGETSLANLLLVCSAHHTLIHEGGFSVQRRRDGTYFFARPDGRPVEAPSAEDAARIAEPSAEDQHEARDARAVYRITSPFSPAIPANPLARRFLSVKRL